MGIRENDADYKVGYFGSQKVLSVSKNFFFIEAHFRIYFY